MKNLILFLIIIFHLLSCVHKIEHKYAVELSDDIDYELLSPKCSDFSDVVFTIYKKGEFDFNGFASARKDDSFITYRPCVFYTPDSIPYMSFFDVIEESSNLQVGEIECGRIKLEKGRYFNEDPIENIAFQGINKFSYAKYLQDGCVIHGYYKILDNSPAYSQLEITDVDKERRIICGKFRFRFGLLPNSGTSTANPSHTLPEIVTFENGIFATRY